MVRSRCTYRKPWPSNTGHHRNRARPETPSDYVSSHLACIVSYSFVFFGFCPCNKGVPGISSRSGTRLLCSARPPRRIYRLKSLPSGIPLRNGPISQCVGRLQQRPGQGAEELQLWATSHQHPFAGVIAPVAAHSTPRFRQQRIAQRAKIAVCFVRYFAHET